MLTQSQLLVTVQDVRSPRSRDHHDCSNCSWISNSLLSARCDIRDSKRRGQFTELVTRHTAHAWGWRGNPFALAVVSICPFNFRLAISQQSHDCRVAADRCLWIFVSIQIEGCRSFCYYGRKRPCVFLVIQSHCRMRQKASEEESTNLRHPVHKCRASSSRRSTNPSANLFTPISCASPKFHAH